MSRTITLGDFLTSQEIKEAEKLYRTAPAGMFAKQCDEQIIAPVIERINRQLGQENSTRYLAYAVEFVLSKEGK
jgi:hypothetical protein